MIRSQRWKGAAFTVPFQLGFVFLYLVPIGYAVYQSLYLQQQSGLGLGGSTEKFVGLDNYLKGLTDSVFMGSVLRVFLFSCVQIPLMLVISLVMALLLDALTSRAAGRFRTLLLVPYMIPGVVAALVWVNLYSPEVGPLTSLGNLFGFSLGLLRALDGLAVHRQPAHLARHRLQHGDHLRGAPERAP